MPHFYLRNKEVVLPKIKAAAELVYHELDQREVVLGGDIIAKPKVRKAVRNIVKMIGSANAMNMN